MIPKAETIRVVSEPRVKLVGLSQYIDDKIEEWCVERGIKYDTDAVADADAIAEFGGRLCYLSFQENKRRHKGNGQNETYLDHIREVGHGSVTEHATFSFVIDDVSRNMTHELVRHRVGVAYSQLSTRYVDQFADDYFGDSGHTLGVYIPPEIQDMRHIRDEWLAIWEKVGLAYFKTFHVLKAQGLETKHARSLARHILPGSACTAILFTVNCRELNHIFSMRGSKFADPEIRKMAIALWREVKGCNLFNHWDLVDGGLVDTSKPQNLNEELRALEQKYAGELKGERLVRSSEETEIDVDEGEILSRLGAH